MVVCYTTYKYIFSLSMSNGGGAAAAIVLASESSQLCSDDDDDGGGDHCLNIMLYTPHS